MRFLFLIPFLILQCKHQDPSGLQVAPNPDHEVNPNILSLDVEDGPYKNAQKVHTFLREKLARLDFGPIYCNEVGVPGRTHPQASGLIQDLRSTTQSKRKRAYFELKGLLHSEQNKNGSVRQVIEQELTESMEPDLVQMGRELYESCEKKLQAIALPDCEDDRFKRTVQQNQKGSQFALASAKQRQVFEELEGSFLSVADTFKKLQIPAKQCHENLADSLWSRIDAELKALPAENNTWYPTKAPVFSPKINTFVDLNFNPKICCQPKEEESGGRLALAVQSQIHKTRNLLKDHKKIYQSFCERDLKGVFLDKASFGFFREGNTFEELDEKPKVEAKPQQSRPGIQLKAGIFLAKDNVLDTFSFWNSFGLGTHYQMSCMDPTTPKAVLDYLRSEEFNGGKTPT